MFSAHNFALSDAEDNTSGPLNTGGIKDLLLLRTLLIIPQKSREQSFCDAKDPFTLLAISKSGSLRILLQQLLVCLNFTSNSEDLLCWCK